jgi:hypothetical protein
METRTIYRVEHLANGRGPYNGWEIAYSEPGDRKKFRRNYYSSYHNPEPGQEDYVLGRILLDDERKEDYRFAFNSLHDLKAWFHRGVALLKRNNFGLFEIEIAVEDSLDLFEEDRQVAYNLDAEINKRLIKWEELRKVKGRPPT